MPAAAAAPLPPSDRDGSDEDDGDGEDGPDPERPPSERGRAARAREDPAEAAITEFLRERCGFGFRAVLGTTEWGRRLLLFSRAPFPHCDGDSERSGAGIADV